MESEQRHKEMDRKRIQMNTKKCIRFFLSLIPGSYWKHILHVECRRIETSTLEKKQRRKETMVKVDCREKKGTQEKDGKQERERAEKVRKENHIFSAIELE